MVGSLYSMEKHTSECDIVEVSGSLDGLNLSANIELLYAFAKVADCRMSRVVGTEDLNCFFGTVWPVDILDYREISEKIMV